MIGRPGGDIINIRERHAFERGPKFHKIHVHSNLEAHTHGLVFIDKEKIQDYVNAYIKQRIPTYAGCYVHYDLVRNYNAAKYIEAYLEKGRQQEPELFL
jgi:hypothetical protein